MTAWSYSSVNTFKQCPKKYYHLKVAKDVKDRGNAATAYGSRVHSAAEKYIRDGKPLEREYKFLQGIVPSEYGCKYGFAPWLERKIENRKEQLCKMVMETFVPPKGS